MPRQTPYNTTRSSGSAASASLGIASGNNRLNSSGTPYIDPRARSSQQINNIVQAGQTLPVPCNGNQFYVLFSSANIDIRPSGGVFNEYTQGTGLNLPDINAFNLLEVKNNTAGAIVFALFVGFDGFIDNRLILANNLTPQVSFPTYPTASAAATVSIIDQSGQPITDVNGDSWYAIQRQAIMVFNPDTGVTLLLQKFGSVVSNGPAVAAIYPQTSLNYPVSGDYTLSVGGGMVNAIVSEIYTALAAVLPTP